MAKIARIWDGSQWVELASSLVNYPDQTGNEGKVLSTDGNTVSWSNISGISGTPLNVPETIVSRDADSIFDISAIDFDTTNTLANATGRIRWDSEEGTIDIGMNNGVVQSVGMEFYIPPTKNNSGVEISAGSLVMATGALGDRITIARAVTDGSINPEYILGVATHNIIDGAEDGLITVDGTVRDIDTSLWIVGTILYPDPSNPGGLTSTPPAAPNIRTPIAIVLRQHQETGRIYVRMYNSHYLTETQDVDITSPQNNNLLRYNSSTQLWENYNPLLLIQSIDGVNSGIDADLLDGQQGSYYLDTSSSSQTKEGDLTITGNLTVNGTTTTFNSVTISIDDKNLELGSVDTPTDSTAEGGGITLKGTTDKTINWIGLTSSWTFSENIDLAQGRVLKINGSPILSATQYAGNAHTVTNGVYTTEFYQDPDWIDTLSWDKIIGTPTTLSGYGITDTLATLTYLGLENVENVALSEWAGNTFISSVGIITTGTWNGTKIDALYIDDAIARLDSPTFGGTVSLPSGTSIGTVTSSEISYLSGVSSNIQTQLDGKLSSSVASTTYAPINSPSFTGSVDFSNSSVIGLDTLPDQTGNSGKYLSTDGTIASWEDSPGTLLYAPDEPQAPVVGQIWVESDVDVAAFDPQLFLRWTKTLSTSQSEFSGLSGGVLLEYSPTFEQVFLNGALLIKGTDYTATDGLTITLSSPASPGDVVEVISLSAFNIANVYTTSEIDSKLQNIETDSVEINNSSNVYSSSTLIDTVNSTIIDTISGSVYRSAEYLIQVSQSNKHTVSKIIILNDENNNVLITEYALIESGSSRIPVSITSEYDNGNILIKATVSDADINSTTVKLHRTAMMV